MRKNRIYSCNFITLYEFWFAGAKIRYKKRQKKPVLVDSLAIVKCHVFSCFRVNSIVTENVIEAL